MNRRSTASGNPRELLRSRCGYTLLELLVASMLIAALMAATWNLMTMYSGFLIAGRSQAVEQQLARSLMDLLATDFRSVVPGHVVPGQEVTSPPMSEASTLGSKTTGLSSSAIDEGSISPDPFAEFELRGLVEQAALLPTESFRGGEHSLTLIVTRPQPDFESALISDNELGQLPATLGDAAALDVDGRLPDGQLPGRPVAVEWTQIVYRFEPPRAVLREERGLPPGLHRFEIPIEYLGLLTQSESQSESLSGDDVFEADEGFGDDSSSDLANMLQFLQTRGVQGVTHEYLPEVVACQFEFLSDAGWRSWWEESFSRDQPAAVRIKVKLLSANEQRELMTRLGSDNSNGAEDAGDSLVEPRESRNAETDPYAGFHPRLFERTILLDAQRISRRSDESVTPSEERLIGSPGFLAGGRP